MQKITVGVRSQIVIPSSIRKKIPHLKPGSVVSVFSPDSNTIMIKVGTKSWVDRMYGSFKDFWQQTDPVQELEKMRDEWDSK